MLAGDSIKPLTRAASRTFGNGRMNKDPSAISAMSLYQQEPDSSKEIANKFRDTFVDNFVTK